MLFKIILQFLKQKVREVTKFIILFIIALILLIGGTIGFFLGTGWVTYTLFHKCKFASLIIDPKNTYFDNLFAFGGMVFTICIFGFVIFIFGKNFIDWIKQNWRTAKEIVQNREMPKTLLEDEDDD